MGRVRSTCSALVRASVVLPFVALPAKDLACWEPASGARVEWRWHSESRHRLEKAELVLDAGTGDELRLEDRQPHLDVRDILEVTLRDRIVERDEYDPTRLERELVRARRATTSDWGLLGSSAEEDRIETQSPFEGAQLVFEWDSEAGEPRARFAPEAEEIADEELLAGLDEGLDLRGLVGGVPRKPGDRWQLDEDALLALVRPGGELAMVAPESDFEGEHDSAAFGWLIGAALVAGEGEAWGRAEYERVSSDDGVHVARIALRGTVEGRGSVREALERLADTLGSGEKWIGYGKRIEVEHTIRFKGVLLWDLEAGRAHALTLDGKSESRLELGIEFEDWGDVTLEYLVELRGELHLEVTASGFE